MRADSRLLQMFVAVADSLSFTRAAETLHVAQPWLSAQIRRLEQQLGITLFVRDSRNVHLSEAGQRLLPAARDVTRCLQRFLVQARRLREENGQRVLRIGLPPYSHFFAARVTLLERFARLDTGVRIETVVGWSPELVQRVGAGELDLAFVVGDIAATLHRLPISRSRCHVYCRRDDPLATQACVYAGDLHGRAVLSFARGLNPALHEQLFGAAQQAGAVLQPDHEMMGERWLQQVLDGHALGLNFIRTPPAHLQAQLAALPYADAEPVVLYLVSRDDDVNGITQAYWAMAEASSHAT